MKPDPALKKRLESAGESELIAVVCQLRTKGRALPEPEQVRACVESMIHEVESETGTAPARVNVFELIASFAVQATAAFLSPLLERDEVASATLSDPGRDMLIRPVDVKPTPRPRRPR